MEETAVGSLDALQALRRIGDRAGDGEVVGLPLEDQRIPASRKSEVRLFREQHHHFLVVLHRRDTKIDSDVADRPHILRTCGVLLGCGSAHRPPDLRNDADRHPLRDVRRHIAPEQKESDAPVRQRRVAWPGNRRGHRDPRVGRLSRERFQLEQSATVDGINSVEARQLKYQILKPRNRIRGHDRERG